MTYQKEQMPSGYRVDLLKCAQPQQKTQEEQQQEQQRTEQIDVHQAFRRDIGGQAIYLVSFHYRRTDSRGTEEKHRKSIECIFEEGSWRALDEVKQPYDLSQRELQALEILRDDSIKGVEYSINNDGQPVKKKTGVTAWFKRILTKDRKN